MSAAVLYRLLADVVMVVHLAFILFVAAGGLLAWCWRPLLWLHVPAVAWGAAIVVVGFTCPLTPLERALRERGGQGRFEEGFIERYLEGVIYPGQFTPHLRVLVALAIIVGWAGLILRWRQTATGQATPRSGISSSR